MSKVKKIDIHSLDELLDTATLENYEYLMVDFRLFVKTYLLLLQEIRNTNPVICKGKKNSEIGKGQFTWINDGKHDLKDIRILDEKGKTIKFKL